MTSKISGPRRRLTVLIVEDHEETRAVYAAHFGHAGYQVETAADGNEAISTALRVHPDAIVLDLALPGVDGWEVAAILRTYVSTRATPIVACTAAAGDDLLERARRAGCDAIVSKPCLPADLERAVAQAVRDKAPTSDRSAG